MQKHYEQSSARTAATGSMTNDARNASQTPNYFNREDVADLIKRLMQYRDRYTNRLIRIFKHYFNHKNFDRLHEALFKVDHLLDAPFFDVWDINARMVYLQVIYPV